MFIFYWNSDGGNVSIDSGKIVNQSQYGTPGVKLGFPWLDYVFLCANVFYAAMIDSMEEGILTKLNTRCPSLIQDVWFGSWFHITKSFVHR